jgi:hypothetical protein
MISKKYHLATSVQYLASGMRIFPHNYKKDAVFNNQKFSGE